MQVTVFEVDGQIITGWMDGWHGQHTPCAVGGFNLGMPFVLGDAVHGLIMARHMFNGWWINRCILYVTTYIDTSTFCK